MTNELNLTSTQAIGVAISVVREGFTSSMDECQKAAPDFEEHLLRMGFKLVKVSERKPG